MNDPEKECTEGMSELVHGLASLHGTRKSIEDGMNNIKSVIRLRHLKADLTHQLWDTEVALLDERSDSMRAIEQIDREISEAKSRILGMWDGEKRTMQYGDIVLSLRGRKSVVIDDGGVLLAALMDHFSADRVAEDFVSAFNKKNLKSFIDLHPQDESVARIEEKINVYLNPSSEQKEV